MIWMDQVFQVLTGVSFANYGVSCARSDSQLNNPDIQWQEGNGQFAVQEFVNTLTDKPIEDEWIMHKGMIQSIGESTGFGSVIESTLLEKVQQIYIQSSTQAHKYWPQVVDAITGILEGPNGIRGEWQYGLKYKKAREGSWWDFSLMKSPPAWAKTVTSTTPAPYRPLPNRGRSQPRVNVFQTPESCIIYPRNQERVTYVSEAKKKQSLKEFVHVKDSAVLDQQSEEICTQHGKAMYTRQMADPENTMSSEEAWDMVKTRCHKNKHCISEWNPHIYCTRLPGGGDAVLDRAEMSDGPDKREVYQVQLKQIFKIASNEAGGPTHARGVHVIMEDEDGHYVTLDLGDSYYF
jgi:hypothetical protein